VVEVRNASRGVTTTYTILGAWDGDPENHIISYKTALGAALLGRKPGETVKVKLAGSEEEYTVLNISRYADRAPASTSA
jgi:transcription elongation GreA/GreB family factor